MSKTAGWVGFVDIYGFSALLKQKNASDIYEALNLFHGQVGAVANEVKECSYFLFSDCFVFAIPAAPPNFREFRIANDMLQRISYEALKYNFLLRGALTFGEYRLSQRYLLGDPVLRAVEIEKELLLPLICVPSRDLQNAGIYGETGIAVEHIPTKTGIIEAMDLRGYPFDLAVKTIDSYLNQTAVHGPQHIAKIWLELRNRIVGTRTSRGDNGTGGISEFN